ncbi:MAG: hypothetical protein JWQ12_1278 [Glaciihabitans sp.]|jgi:HEAT repeat protein|nr:hypothetical protein [Glaciihabitans sp.]
MEIIAEETRKAEAPLVRDLREAGFQVDSLWDLVNAKYSFPRAIPILIEHLTRDYPTRIRSGIARALAGPESAPYWFQLEQYFKLAEDTSEKQAFAVALRAAATEEHVEDLIRLFKDPSNGRNRGLFIAPLVRSKNPAARAAVEAVEEDPVLGHEAKLRLYGRKKRAQS